MARPWHFFRSGAARGKEIELLPDRVAAAGRVD
jgi:hypothetical protein